MFRFKASSKCSLVVQYAIGDVGRMLWSTLLWDWLCTNCQMDAKQHGTWLKQFNCYTKHCIMSLSFAIWYQLHSADILFKNGIRLETARRLWRQWSMTAVFWHIRERILSFVMTFTCKWTSAACVTAMNGTFCFEFDGDVVWCDRCWIVHPAMIKDLPWFSVSLGQSEESALNGRFWFFGWMLKLVIGCLWLFVQILKKSWRCTDAQIIDAVFFLWCL